MTRRVLLSIWSKRAQLNETADREDEAIMTAQNFGAQNKKNLTKILWMTLLTSTTISIVMSGLAVLLYRPLVSLFLPQKAFASASDYSASLEVAHQRLLVIALFYFVDSWMDNMVIGA